MKCWGLLCVILSTVNLRVMASECGCQALSTCYQQMLDDLKDGEETTCIENAALGAGTVTLYLKALSVYCRDFVKVLTDSFTYDGRNLYEVVIDFKLRSNVSARPTFLIDAGQEGGTEAVRLALYVIEQLVACKENRDLIDKVRWVIMPSANPDAQEYTRYNADSFPWRKNCRTVEDNNGLGIDITRNFDSQFLTCKKVESGFSPIYPGSEPFSEQESKFIKSVFDKHKHSIKLYLSIKKNGHHIAYPYAYTKNAPSNLEDLQKIASNVAYRVNQKVNGINLFGNDSIYYFEDEPHCGHSVDYAHDQGIPFAFEMRVFFESANILMSSFHNMPRGYESSLRLGYFAGIRELYNVINDKKLQDRARRFKSPYNIYSFE